MGYPHTIPVHDLFWGIIKFLLSLTSFWVQASISSGDYDSAPISSRFVFSCLLSLAKIVQEYNVLKKITFRFL